MMLWLRISFWAVVALSKVILQTPIDHAARVQLMGVVRRFDVMPPKNLQSFISSLDIVIISTKKNGAIPFVVASK